MMSVMERFPTLTTKKNIHETLDVRTIGNLTTVYIEGTSVVSYSSEQREYFGKKIELRKKGLKGYLFFNTDVFRNFDLKKPKNTKSEMENIAKAFFKVNGENYVALVQYLSEDGTSSEHYHTLEETIIQFAGKSTIELRPVEDDTDWQMIELGQGDTIRIPPETIHVIRAMDQGSLTVPIKQTLENKNDHFYKTKSNSRIRQEVKELHAGGFESGYGESSAIRRYYDGLSPQEKERFGRIFGRF